MYIYLLLNDCKSLLPQREKTNNQYSVDFLFVLLLTPRTSCNKVSYLACLLAAFSSCE